MRLASSSIFSMSTLTAFTRWARGQRGRFARAWAVYQLVTADTQQPPAAMHAHLDKRGALVKLQQALVV